MSAIDRLRVLARPSRLMAATVLGLSVAGIALAADTSSPEDRVRALLKTRLPKGERSRSSVRWPVAPSSSKRGRPSGASHAAPIAA